MLNEHFTRLAMIARWKPVHLGHGRILNALCDHADQVLIGIGSSNRYNLRNPFTLTETEDMLRLVLDGRNNYTLLPIPDLDDGPRWRLMVKDLLGTLDLFVTANPYVASLLRDDYRIIRPVELIPSEEQVPIDGSGVRRAMAQGEAWEKWVPPAVADYLKSNHLDIRFREEFGLQTLALETIIQ